MSNREARRAAQRYLKAESAKQPAALAEVPRETWPAAMSCADRPPLKVWRSRDFLVQMFRAHDPAEFRLSVLRTVLNDTGSRWADGIPWEDLQRLKREAGFGDRDAVEVYPRDVDVANLRHLWIMRAPLEFAWRS